MTTNHHPGRLAALPLALFFVWGCGPIDADDVPIRIDVDDEPAPEIAVEESEQRWRIAESCEPLQCRRLCGTGDDGCGTPIDCGPCGEAGHLRLSEIEMALVRGQTRVLDAWVADDDGHIFLEPDIVWSSRDPEIASVNEEGSVFGTSIGTTVIIARLGELDAGVYVKVIEGPEQAQFRIARGCTDPGDTDC